MKNPSQEQFDPLRFEGVRLEERESFESVEGLGRAVLSEPRFHILGRVSPAPVEVGLRWELPAAERSVQASALHVEFALSEQSEAGFIEFARHFGRLGVGETLSAPVEVGEDLYAGCAEHYDMWVDCQRLIRLGVALSWFDPTWQSGSTEEQSRRARSGSITSDEKQVRARLWLDLDEMVTWKGAPKGLDKKTRWTSAQVSCSRYRFGGGDGTWVFEGRGGVSDDTSTYRDAMLAALANEVIGEHARLVAKPDKRRFSFEAQSLWALMWLQCLTQAWAPIDYRWCLHCGTVFAAPYKRSDRLFCSIDCTRANHAWRTEEAMRLAREERWSVVEIVERIYDARQLDSQKKRVNAEARVQKWISS